jgi:hypothetical protein
MTFGARKAASPSPAAIAVHDAGDMGWHLPEIDAVGCHG